jgi:hypothetical protein
MFLRAVDALCEELQRTCGLTRFSIVVDRASRPLTVTLENDFHGIRRHGTARFALELRDGDRRLGEVVLEDALAHAYPEEVRSAAGDVLARHVHALRDVLPT